MRWPRRCAAFPSRWWPWSLAATRLPRSAWATPARSSAARAKGPRRSLPRSPRPDAGSPPGRSRRWRSWRSSGYAIQCRSDLVRAGALADLFADAVGALRQHRHAIQTFTRRDVEGPLVRSAERRIRRLARHLDGAEIFALGVEHLHTGHGGDVDAALAIERHSVGAALLALGDVAQLRKGALVLHAAVGLDVVGVHDRAEGVIDDQRPSVAREGEPVGPCDLVVEDDGLLGAGRQIVDIGDAAGLDRSRAGVGDVDAALGVDDQIVRRQERLALDALRDRGHRAVAAALADALAAAFRRQQVALGRHRQAVGAIGLLAHEIDLSARIEPVDSIGADVGEVEPAIGRGDRSFGEDESLLHQLRLGARRDDAGNARRRLRASAPGEQHEHPGCGGGTPRKSLWTDGHVFLPMLL